MKKKPYTNAELFYKICNILKENNLLPEDILDYNISSSKEPIMDIEFKITNDLDYGGNEGIYLVLYIRKQHEKEQVLGTFKTLNTDNESMYKMAKLIADFIITTNEFINENSDDFEWQGYKIYTYTQNNIKSISYYCCQDKESCDKKSQKLLETYPKILIVDNRTKKEYLKEKKIG